MQRVLNPLCKEMENKGVVVVRVNEHGEDYRAQSLHPVKDL